MWVTISLLRFICGWTDNVPAPRIIHYRCYKLDDAINCKREMVMLYLPNEAVEIVDLYAFLAMHDKMGAEIMSKRVVYESNIKGDWVIKTDVQELWERRCVDCWRATRLILLRIFTSVLQQIPGTTTTSSPSQTRRRYAESRLLLLDAKGISWTAMGISWGDIDCTRPTRVSFTRRVDTMAREVYRTTGTHSSVSKPKWTKWIWSASTCCTRSISVCRRCSAVTFVSYLPLTLCRFPNQRETWTVGLCCSSCWIIINSSRWQDLAIIRFRRPLPRSTKATDTTRTRNSWSNSFLNQGVVQSELV